MGDAAPVSVLDIRDEANAFVVKGTVDKTIKITNDPDTGVKVSNLFEEETAGLVKYSNNNNINNGTVAWLSRADFEGTMPEVTRQASLTRELSYFDELYRTTIYSTGIEGVGTKESTVNSAAEDVAGKATSGEWTESEWFANRAKAGYSEMDENGNRIIKRSATEGRADKKIVDGEAGSGETSKILLYELTKYEYDDAMWDLYLDQLTIQEMMNFVTYGGFGMWGVDELGAPQTRTPDGPESLCFDKGLVMGYAYQCMVACTFNKELSYEVGRSFGNEAMWATTTRSTKK